MISTARQLVVPAYLFLCVVLGGSRQGIVGPLILQLLALPIIAWAILARAAQDDAREGRVVFVLLAAAATLIGVQLVPLPPGLWSGLPGRDAVARGFAEIGEPLPWLPISLRPYKTLTVLMALLPPTAVLLGMIKLRAYKRNWLVAAVVAATLAGVLLGALQLSGSSLAGHDWYLYRVTNHGAAVGFFANSNHMATLLLVAISLLAGLIARSRFRGGKSLKRILGLAVPAMLVLGLGLLLNHSLAGLLLAVPVSIASLLLIFRTSWSSRSRLLLGATILPLLLATAVLLNSLPWITQDLSFVERKEIHRTSVEAAKTNLALGSGFATFDTVLPQYENSQAVDRTYVNNAHNDYLEMVIEGGLPALLLLAIFLLWWGRHALRLWRVGNDAIAIAATIASGAILLHSIVDYPLRTSAMSAVFSACLGLMVLGRGFRKQPPAGFVRAPRHLQA